MDRLSDLPDDILRHAMSFLTSRQAARTCALSKRWGRLWRSVPCLHVDQTEFDRLWTPPESQYQRFADFTNKLLSSHGAPRLEAFRLRVPRTPSDKRTEREVQGWVHRGVSLCPSTLEVHGGSPRIDLASLGSSSSCCRLTRLHLHNASLLGSFAVQLSSGCPVLEDLELDSCIFEFNEITSRTLKNLVVVRCLNYTEEPLIIAAPSLATLHLDSEKVPYCFDHGVLVTESASLVKASIWLPSKNMVKLLGGLTNLKILELAEIGMQDMLHEESNNFQTFYNLRTLLFKDCKLKLMQMFWHILQNAPSLEKLTLWCCEFSGPRKRKRKTKTKRIYLEQQEQTSFECKNLKLVEIVHENDDIHELFELQLAIWRNLTGVDIKLKKIERPVNHGRRRWRGCYCYHPAFTGRASLPNTRFHA